MIRSQALKLISEYKDKRALYFELVGTLYPTMMYQELMKMRAKYIKDGGDPTHLPEVPPPLFSGHAPADPYQLKSLYQHG